ncbi:AMP-binding protein [Sphingobium boeckii]|uniref:3-methylmercaptopropionyl-CoA ligase n=1 Tax=Sphingobium boeckii TaxID=1082345 RepID=A0A7W9AFT3_9SPHN|nr:AMP-binding protein [Sphingobium boeckii]MBB5684825.1 acyl-CoA synthetase (AMP-forming)/AMP-acid ligase II [Sphingobium boeckii]
MTVADLNWRNGTIPPHLQRYDGTGVWRDRPFGDIARDRAMSRPEAIAFAGAEIRTVADIVGDAEALAAGLLYIGLTEGDVVGFQLPNWEECAVINLAAAMAGLVVNPISPIYRDVEVQQMLADSGCRAVFLTSMHRRFDYSAMIGRIRPSLPSLDHVIHVREDAPTSYDALIEVGRGRALGTPAPAAAAVKLLLYTSGTTGRAKAVLHSHNSTARFVDACTRHWSVSEGETILMPSPVTHITGYSFGLEMPFLSGTQTILMEAWDADEAIRLIDRHQVTGTISATPFLQELTRAARAAGNHLPSLRFFACGGAAVPPEIIRDANANMAAEPGFRVFGCSELPMITLDWRGADQGERAATTDGEPIDYEVLVVDDSGAILPAGKEGEILARGPSMFIGYADPAQTSEVITPEGYFRTGDLGMLTTENALLISGRKKDLIIRGGENISAKEIEDVLHRCPGILEAAVVAMPHERLGEGVCAYVVTSLDHTPTERAIIDFVIAQGLARQKTPERVVIVEALPRTITGKIRKDQLRSDARALKAALAPMSPA